MKIFFVVLSLVFTSSLLAKTSTKSKKKVVKVDTNLRQEMNQISQKIRNLGPILASEENFSKEKNKTVIVTSLNDIQNKFKNLKKHPTIELQGLSINQLIMSEELKDVIHLVNKGKTAQGRAKLLSTLNLCVSCHSQSPGMQSTKLFSDADISNYQINNFEKAELYFVTRDYDKAINLYDDYLLKSKKTDDDELILKGLERQLIYYVKLKKDFTAGKNYFEGLLKKNTFSEGVTHEVNDWIKMLSGKPLWENFNASVVKEEEMDKFLKQFVTDDEEGPIFTTTNSSEVYDLNLSAILLDYYNAHPETKLGGKILYWLSILDKRINDDLFFSIGDFYLLACMEKYSKDPIAKDCYEAYVDDMQINLISNGKTDKASMEEKKETRAKIERLKKLVDYKEDLEE